MAAEHATVTAITDFVGATGLARVGEAITHEEASIRIVCRAVAEKHIPAPG
jgi:hypothetical protein